MEIVGVRVHGSTRLLSEYSGDLRTEVDAHGVLRVRDSRSIVIATFAAGEWKYTELIQRASESKVTYTVNIPSGMSPTVHAVSSVDVSKLKGQVSVLKEKIDSL